MVGAAERRRWQSRLVWVRELRYDSGVTLSRDTGQVTHKIAPNIDEERDRLITGLDLARMVLDIYQIRGIGPTPGSEAELHQRRASQRAH
jgi:hypothetical protein